MTPLSLFGGQPGALAAKVDEGKGAGKRHSNFVTSRAPPDGQTELGLGSRRCAHRPPPANPHPGKPRSVPHLSLVPFADPGSAPASRRRPPRLSRCPQPKFGGATLLLLPDPLLPLPVGIGLATGSAGQPTYHCRPVADQRGWRPDRVLNPCSPLREKPLPLCVWLRDQSTPTAALRAFRLSSIGRPSDKAEGSALVPSFDRLAVQSP
ncbi:uncharacterized protein PAN0_010c4010 [Moesziomyces antarcticus]|uniref:Uncharacterized protein n=2 Tax=Pseudozyma antarctica TaxID=84753 RepID=A0A5C3FM11_PSEA2|nr:uncharacterized protein PAN0_010c4010 [Moesziomyces antarcticus]GAK65789.1 hypothetical protein PAN0_010c4010 [Moesziomyces antarcticus]SPO45418.1 uncharacterized protein PSANT_03104 [Moesziomyces antarcticus]